jgi:hypothetical protein
LRVPLRLASEVPSLRVSDAGQPRNVEAPVDTVPSHVVENGCMLHIADDDRPINSSAGQAGRVVSEGDAPDPAHMALQDSQAISTPRVPQLSGRVETGAASHAGPISPLPLAWFEQRLRIVEHQQTASMRGSCSRAASRSDSADGGTSCWSDRKPMAPASHSRTGGASRALRQ